MPQMSPMSWLLILFMFFFTVSIMINSFKSYKTLQTKKFSIKKKQKSLTW